MDPIHTSLLVTQLSSQVMIPCSSNAPERAAKPGKRFAVGGLEFYRIQ